MNYYWFNRQEILQKTIEKYWKEKTAEYYKQNKEAIKEKSKEHLKTCHEKKKTRLKSINNNHQEQQKTNDELLQYKKSFLKNKWFFIFFLI